jgi:hypothetical protein
MAAHNTSPYNQQIVVSISKLNFLEKSFIEYLSRLTKEEANTKAFEYISYTSYKWKGNSSIFNIKTNIKCVTHTDYYNSETNLESLGLVHFTNDGMFYGTAKQYGIEPIFYIGEFTITPQIFMVDFETLKQGKLQFILKK